MGQEKICKMRTTFGRVPVAVVVLCLCLQVALGQDPGAQTEDIWNTANEGDSCTGHGRTTCSWNMVCREGKCKTVRLQYGCLSDQDCNTKENTGWNCNVEQSRCYKIITQNTKEVYQATKDKYPNALNGLPDDRNNNLHG